MIKGIINILENDSAVTTLVSQKIHAYLVPQSTAAPYIRVWVVSNTPIDSKEGASGFDKVRIQVDCVAESYATAQSISDAVRSALDDYTGVANTVDIIGLRLEDENDLFDTESDFFTKALDFMVIIRR